MQELLINNLFERKEIYPQQLVIENQQVDQQGIHAVFSGTVSSPNAEKWKEALVR